MAKKILKISGITLLVLFLLAFILPFFFKDKIVALVKTEVNKNLNAKVDFKDASLSFFRHFPRVSLALEDLYIAGVDHFKGDTLLQVKELDVAVNLWSVIGGDQIKVHAVNLESPTIHAIVDKEGRANWDIALPDTTTSASTDTATAFHIALKQYAITNGNIRYNDIPGNMYAQITRLDHSGSGDFTQDRFTLQTETSAEKVDFSYGGVPYLNAVKTILNTDIGINTNESIYTFDTDDVQLNELKLNTKGSFQLVNDSSYKMDISFKTPDNTFKSILSLIPAVYSTEFDKIQTKGTAAFEGMVKGMYTPTQLPAFNVALQVKDGFFQYPDLPKPVQNIQVDAKLSNPDGVTDHTAIEVSRGHIEMDNEPFDFKFIFRNPETIKYIDAVAKGRLDLSKLTQLVKLEKGTQLAGIIHADVFAKGNMSAIETQSGPFTAGGFLDVQSLNYASPAIPQPVKNGNMRINITNEGGVADQTNISIPAGHIEFGANPVDFTLNLLKPVTDIIFSGSAKGKFDLNTVQQLVTLEPGTSLSGMVEGDVTFAGSNKLVEEEKYDQIKLNGTVAVNNLKYADKDYPEGVAISRTSATMNNDVITLNELRGNFKKTNFSAIGTLNNAVGYAMNDETLSGKLNVKADKMNLNDWMGTDTATAEASTSSDPFLVPGKINFNLTAAADEVVYDKVTYKNVHGNLQLANETVTLQQLQTEALDGTIAFNGTYSTLRNKQQPDISISYDVKNVDVQKAFFAFNTVQQLMPIGRFLGGKLSSQLSMNGKLGGDMMPLLNSLTGEGTLFLIDGFLKKFQPLEKLASSLNVSELKEISLKDVKNYFEFDHGKVLVKPFTVKVKDIEMEIGGTHGFDQSINYLVNLKVPRSKLGSQGNNLLNSLVTQANNKGIPVKLGETVNFNVAMTGSMTNPNLKYDLKEVAGDVKTQMQEQAKEFVQTKVDSAKAALKDTAQAIKQELLKSAEEELRKKILGNKDTASSNTPAPNPVKKAEETLKGIKGLLKKKDTTSKN